MLVVTTGHVPGYEIHAVFGEVHGVIARSRNVYAEGVKLLSGSPNPRARVALHRWRDEAIAQMTQLAYQRGANAVVEMRFDHREISVNWVEICAYGTAVFIVPGTVPPVSGAPAATARGQAAAPHQGTQIA
jgi:uncharacterized protein YbjQ (UPF0145 family)